MYVCVYTHMTKYVPGTVVVYRLANEVINFPELRRVMVHRFPFTAVTYVGSVPG